jgi:hypothetical protein
VNQNIRKIGEKGREVFTDFGFMFSIFLHPRMKSTCAQWNLAKERAEILQKGHGWMSFTKMKQVSHNLFFRLFGAECHLDPLDGCLKKLRRARMIVVY